MGKLTISVATFKFAKCNKLPKGTVLSRWPHRGTCFLEGHLHLAWPMDFQRQALRQLAQLLVHSWGDVARIVRNIWKTMFQTTSHYQSMGFWVYVMIMMIHSSEIRP